jgi:hypothetical protein
MNRWALRPTGMFTGRHALIGMSMAMDCFCRTDALAFLVQLPPRRSAEVYRPSTPTPKQVAASVARMECSEIRDGPRHPIPHYASLHAGYFLRETKMRKPARVRPWRLKPHRPAA